MPLHLRRAANGLRVPVQDVHTHTHTHTNNKLHASYLETKQVVCSLQQSVVSDIMWYFYTLKITFYYSICQQIWKTQPWPQDCKRSVFIQIPKNGNAKECSNYRTIALISQASKVMLKILQARLHQYTNREHPDVKAGFRKGRGTRDQIANICWIIKKARELQKNIYFCFIDYAKVFDCVDHNKLENSKRDGNTRPPDLPLEKPIGRSGSNS